jgi:uncharacterized FlgJ-related protein
MKLFKFSREKLVYEPVRYCYSIKTIAFLVLFICAIFFAFMPTPTVEYINGEKVVSIEHHDKFSEKKLVEALKGLNLKNERIVYAQMKLESGNFKSYKFRELNNLMGMKLPRNRPTTAIDSDKSGYSIYPTWRHSVYDFGLYYAAYTKDLNRQQYIQYLRDHYAEDIDYVSKIMVIADSEETKKLFEQ